MRAGVGGSRGGTGWATKQQVLIHLRAATPQSSSSEGSSPWSMVSVPGDLLWGNSDGEQSGCCDGTSDCSVTLPAVGLSSGSLPMGSCFKSASDIPEECQMLRLHPEEGFET